MEVNIMEIKIYDRSFAHASLFGNGDLKLNSNNISWYRGSEAKDICFFTDFCLQFIHIPNISKGTINVAWLLEPPSIASQNYQWIQNNYKLFDYVLTYDKSLLGLDKRFVWCPHGGCWIDSKDFNAYDKTKNISIIASDKRTTEGHQLRHEVINTLGKEIDLICGRGYKPLNYKLDALKDYKYSIVIENGKFDTYFTEKLVDCFVTGTIPIYWGCSLRNIFDESGVLYFNNVSELSHIIDKIKTGSIKYENLIGAVKRNFSIAKQYTITEDWIHDNFIRRII